MNQENTEDGTQEDEQKWDELLSSPESMEFLEEMAKKALEEFNDKTKSQNKTA